MIAYDNSDFIGNVLPGTSVSKSFTVGSGAYRILWITILGDDGTGGNDDISAVTYNGVSAQLLDKHRGSFSNNNRWIYLYYLTNPTSGSNTLSVSCTNSHFLSVLASAYSGVDQSNPVDTFFTGDRNDTNNEIISVITTGVDNAWVLLASHVLQGGAPPTLTGGVMRQYDTTYFNVEFSDYDQAITPSNTAVTMTLDGNTFGLISFSTIMVSMRPAIPINDFIVRPPLMRPHPFSPGLAR